MDIEIIVRDVIAEGHRLRAQVDMSQRQGFKHRDICLIQPRALSRLRRLKTAILNVRQNPHDLAHFIFKVPCLGYFLRWIVCIFRLPRLLRKIREDLSSIHRDVSSMESRVIEAHSLEMDDLLERLKYLERKVNASHSPKDIG